MIIPKLIKHLHDLVSDFSEQTGSFEIEFTENKTFAEWSLNYNLIKIQFVLTKKEKILCPISTMFCRIYLGKNDAYFYHLPELMEYLEPDNFKCYYFSYIESAERMEACFSVLASFLKENFAKINELAQNDELYVKAKEGKIQEMTSLFTGDSPDPDMEEFAINGYENYVLLIRYTGEGAYRQCLCGQYEKALKTYEKMERKGALTRYEKRLVSFLRNLPLGYEFMPEECNSIRIVKQLDAPSSEGLNIIITALVCEIVFGVFFALVILGINTVLSAESLYFVGMPWYEGFLLAGLPALFGGIAFRNYIRKYRQRDSYQKTKAYEVLMTPKWVEITARFLFFIAFVIMMFLNLVLPFASTVFYPQYMAYRDGDTLLPLEKNSFNYKDIKTVYYSEGIYNDFGEFIDRPSYLLEFEDGTVWDSDCLCSIEEVERFVLPIIENYYKEIEIIEDRNKFIDR